MEMATKPTAGLDALVDGDLEKMSRDELIETVLRWRNMAPMIKDVCHELSDYRQISPTPAELKSHIDETMRMYRDTIEQQTIQIQEMRQFIDEMTDDPLQISKRLEQHMGRGKKPRLN